MKVNLIKSSFVTLKVDLSIYSTLCNLMLKRKLPGMSIDLVNCYTKWYLTKYLVI